MVSCRLELKVIPGARRQSHEWLGEVLKVKIATAPEKGKANLAVLAYLSALLNVPVSAIHLCRGQTSPHKLVEIQGLDLATVKTLMIESRQSQ